MGNKRKYVVLRARRGLRPRDPFSGLSGIRFRESMIGAAALQSESTVHAEELSSRDVREMVRDPAVAAITPAMPIKLVKPLTVAGDAAIDAWGIGEVGAIDTPFDGGGVEVAVLDTGIDRAHDAFRGVDIVESDFSGSGDGDRNGHGTHCAGTIFGRDVDGTRIGVARGVRRALIGKVLSDDGGGSSDSLFRAMNWALDQGARVISMSLGFDFPGLVLGLTDDGWPVDLATSTALEAYRGNLRMFDAIMDMAAARIPFDGGAVVVAAAGNESRRGQDQRYEIAASIPAAANEVISVAALQRRQDGLGVADFSNTLADISAPGVNILSARKGGGLVAMSGTSMATPHVAGLLALWWQALRQQPVLVNAALVSGRLLAVARTEGFAPEVEIADRGVGIAVAPR